VPLRSAGLGVVLLLAACGSSGGSGSSSDRLVVERPRIGATPAGADAALYFDVTSPVDDRLVAVDAEIAGSTSLHETDEQNGSIMVEVGSFPLEGGRVVRLEPFGDHVMLEGLSEDLQPGDEVNVTLRFEQHESVEVTAEVEQLFDLAWEDA
jgi:copper(I)-binding protein